MLMPRRQILLAMSAAVLSACATPLRPTLAYLGGSVSYRERMQWPQDKTLLRVRLLDTSANLPAPQVLAEQSLEKTRFPATFSVCYDPSAILPGHRYVVDARLFVDGELRMQSTEDYPVLDAGLSAPQIVLHMLVSP